MIQALRVRPILHYPPDVGQQDEFFRLQGYRYLACDFIRIYIVSISVSPYTEGIYHGYDVILDELSHHGCIDGRYLSHEAEVVFALYLLDPDEAVLPAAQAKGLRS